MCIDIKLPANVIYKVEKVNVYGIAHINIKQIVMLICGLLCSLFQQVQLLLAGLTESPTEKQTGNGHHI